jgi:hypothetical protein
VSPLEGSDPRAKRAFARVHASFAQGKAAWADGDEAGEALSLAQISVEHLAGGRLDEAIATASAALELDEEHNDGTAWREFAILVEEAAELIR